MGPLGRGGAHVPVRDLNMALGEVGGPILGRCLLAERGACGCRGARGAGWHRRGSSGCVK